MRGTQAVRRGTFCTQFRPQKELLTCTFFVYISLLYIVRAQTVSEPWYFS